jgi:vacuolar-type H+-ATPase subunit E/Vma4
MKFSWKAETAKAEKDRDAALAELHRVRQDMRLRAESHIREAHMFRTEIELWKRHARATGAALEVLLKLDRKIPSHSIVQNVLDPTDH